MSELTEFNTAANEKETTDFYLPASAVSPDFDRINDVVDDLFNFHGVVLISETYNK